MNILVFHTGSLGDTLVAVPALWVIRESFPDAHITMLADEQLGRTLVKASEILDGSGLIDDYIHYPAHKRLALLSLLLRLRKMKVDSLVYLIRVYANERPIWRDKFYFQLAGVRRLIGMSEAGKSAAASTTAPLAMVPHISDTLLARLSADGLATPPAQHGRLDIGIGDREQASVDRWLSPLPDAGGRSWFALGLGSKMPCKVWPFERYLAVTRRLIAEFDLWPVVFGGPSDRELGERFIREAARGFVAAGELGIRDAMAAMGRCRLFVGNDTGTMHMAAASGVRCVVPFSSRQAPGMWYPYGEGHVVLRTPVPCEGCLLDVCVIHQMKCLLSITVDDVYDACRRVLGNDM